MSFVPRFTIMNPITAALTAIECAWVFLKAATLSEAWIARNGSERSAAESAPHHAYRRDVISLNDVAARCGVGG